MVKKSKYLFYVANFYVVEDFEEHCPPLRYEEQHENHGVDCRLLFMLLILIDQLEAKIWWLFSTE